MRRRIIQQKSVFLKAASFWPKKKRYFFNEAVIYGDVNYMAKLIPRSTLLIGY